MDRPRTGSGSIHLYLKGDRMRKRVYGTQREEREREGERKIEGGRGRMRESEGERERERDGEGEGEGKREEDEVGGKEGGRGDGERGVRETNVINEIKVFCPPFRKENVQCKHISGA